MPFLGPTPEAVGLAVGRGNQPRFLHRDWTPGREAYLGTFAGAGRDSTLIGRSHSTREGGVDLRGGTP